MNYDNYRAAVKAGKKSIPAHPAKGSTEVETAGQLCSLDSIIKKDDIAAELPLGLIDIPMELICGTRTAGRASAFAPNFMPALPEGTEFAQKWTHLYNAHISEGIREPIRAYEYLNKYYILEGNKRVSVMKFAGADSIPGYVTRLVPVYKDQPEIRKYYEFIEFYNLTSINYLLFSREGSYTDLLRQVDKMPGQRWTTDERIDFRSAYSRFSVSLDKRGGQELNLTYGDALLIYLHLYGYGSLQNDSLDQIQNNLKSMWDELVLSANNNQVAVRLDPSPDKAHIIRKIVPTREASAHYNIAFIHTKNTIDSGWTYSHELGRHYIEDVFGDSISTTCYDNIVGSEAAYAAIIRAIDEGHNIIFTTTPEFLDASLKAAIEHPEVKILNCSINTSHKYIRTYYGRMYEAKFLMGALAGILTDNNMIGYLADYPIYGMNANINAFALGARMVNPHCKIYLEWSTTKANDGVNLIKKFTDLGISIISMQDMIVPKDASRYYGLCSVNGGVPNNIAAPIWHWGKYYELIIRSIRSGTWNADASKDKEMALNYWWGMSAGVIDVILSENIDYGTRKLIELMTDAICKSRLYPFAHTIVAKDKSLHGNPDHAMTPQDIITMNWLCDNVIGSIPDVSDLREDAQRVVSIKGTNL